MKEEHAKEGRWNGRSRRGNEIHINHTLMLDFSVMGRFSSKNSHGDASSAASPLWPPRRANSTEVPLVCFSLACGNVSRTAVSFGNSFIHLPSFLPPSLPPSFFPSFPPSLLPTSPTSPSSYLPHRRPIDTHKEIADMSVGRRQHDEHSILRKVDIEGPQRTNREAYHQSNQHSFVLLLPPPAPPIQRIPSSKPVWRCTQRWFVRYFFSFFFYYHFVFF